MSQRDSHRNRQYGGSSRGPDDRDRDRGSGSGSGRDRDPQGYHRDRDPHSYPRPPSEQGRGGSGGRELYPGPPPIPSREQPRQGGGVGYGGGGGQYQYQQQPAPGDSRQYSDAGQQQYSSAQSSHQQYSRGQHQQYGGAGQYEQPHQQYGGGQHQQQHQQYSGASQYPQQQQRYGTAQHPQGAQGYQGGPAGSSRQQGGQPSYGGSSRQPPAPHYPDQRGGYSQQGQAGYGGGGDPGYGGGARGSYDQHPPYEQQGGQGGRYGGGGGGGGYGGGGGGGPDRGHSGGGGGGGGDRGGGGGRGGAGGRGGWPGPYQGGRGGRGHGGGRGPPTSFLEGPQGELLVQQEWEKLRKSANFTRHDPPAAGAGSAGGAGSSGVQSGGAAVPGGAGGATGGASGSAPPPAAAGGGSSGGGGGGGSASGGGSNDPAGGGGGGAAPSSSTIAGEVDQMEVSEGEQEELVQMPRFALRPPEDGRLADRTLTVLSNYYPLNITGDQLVIAQYDVNFEMLRQPRPGGAADRGPGGEAGRGGGDRGDRGDRGGGGRGGGRGGAQGREDPNRPPATAKEIMAAVAAQANWHGVAWAHDGGKQLLLVAAGIAGQEQRVVPQQAEFRVQAPARMRDGRIVTGRNWNVVLQRTRTINVGEILPVIADELQDALRAEDSDVAWQDAYPRYTDVKTLLEVWIGRAAAGPVGRDLRGRQQQVEVLALKRGLFFIDAQPNQGDRKSKGMLLQAGINLGVRLTRAGPALALDTTKGPFLDHSITLVEFMVKLLGLRGPRDLAGALREPRNRHLVDKALKKRQVRYYRQMANPGGTTGFEADKLDDLPCNRKTFDYRGQDITIQEYFAVHQAERWELDYPEVPGVVMRGHRFICIPPELLRFAAGQRISALSGDQAADLIRAGGDVTPQQHAADINRMVTEQLRVGDNPQLRAANIQVAQQAVEVLARVLPPPWLLYSRNTAGHGQAPQQQQQVAPQDRIFAQPKEGTWNMERPGLGFKTGAPLKRWGLLVAVDRHRDRLQDRDLLQWLRDLQARMEQLGMEVGLPVYGERGPSVWRDCTEWWDPREEVGQALQRVVEKVKRVGGSDPTKSHCDLVVVVIPDKPSPLYDEVKIAAEVQTEQGRSKSGVMTQVVVASKAGLIGKTYTGNRRSQYQANLSMKINVKLGGVNHSWGVSPALFMEPLLGKERRVMVFGLDVTHLSADRHDPTLPSIAALVGSMDPYLTRYQSRILIQEPGEEVVGQNTDGLAEEIFNLVNAWFNANGRQLPDVLVFYRDGVSDGELAQVREQEGGALQQAIKEANKGLVDDSGPRWEPKLIYIVVQKHHNTRLFRKRGSGVSNRESDLSNVPAGTVVDNPEMTSPHLYDFYLNAHAPLKGTSRCGRYIVLDDQVGCGADAIQLLTYWLCYLYCRCTRAVSLPVPVAYSHLAAYRARILAKDWGFGGAWHGRGQVPAGQGQDRAGQLGRCLNKLKSEMYFV